MAVKILIYTFSFPRPLFFPAPGVGGRGQGLGGPTQQAGADPAASAKSLSFADNLSFFYILPPDIQTLSLDCTSFGSLNCYFANFTTRSPCCQGKLLDTRSAGQDRLVFENNSHPSAPLPRYYILLFRSVLLSSAEQKGIEKASRQRNKKQNTFFDKKMRCVIIIDQCI